MGSALIPSTFDRTRAAPASQDATDSTATPSGRKKARSRTWPSGARFGNLEEQNAQARRPSVDGDGSSGGTTNPLALSGCCTAGRTYARDTETLDMSLIERSVPAGPG